MFAGRSLPKLPLLSVAFLGLLGASPLSAEEVATAIAPPAVRLGVAAPCRIVRPTFEPKAAAREIVTPTRYPGGAKLSLPVATPCPAKVQTIDL
jgi:hypothetical protein